MISNFFTPTSLSLLWYFCCVILILCATILANIFTPKRQSSLIIHAAINLIAALSVAAFWLKNPSLLFLEAALVFAIISCVTKNKKIILLYFAATLLAILFVTIFQHGDEKIIFYVILFPLLGLVPFQSWYLSFFESTSLGVVAAFVCFQGAFIWVAQSLLNLQSGMIFYSLLAVSSLAASALAYIQNNPRRVLAYLISSQLGFFSFAHASTSFAMNFGSLYMMLALFGASTGFIMMVAALEARRDNLDLARPCGAYQSYPKLAYYLLIFGLISSGLPLSIGYVAEDLIFESSFEVEPIIDILWLISIAINSITIVKMFLFLFHGQTRKEKGLGQLDLRRGEVFAVAATIIILFLTVIISGSNSVKL